MKFINVEQGPVTSAELHVGDVWKIILPTRTLISRERVMRVISLSGMKVVMQELFSPITVELLITDVTFVHKVTED